MKGSVKKEIETAKACFILIWNNVFKNMEKIVTAIKKITPLTAIGTCIKKLLLTEIYLDLKRGERNEIGDETET